MTPKRRANGLVERMERTGIEPVTFGLQSQFGGGDGGRPAATNTSSHAGLRPARRIRPAWLREPLSDCFGHE